MAKFVRYKTDLPFVDRAISQKDWEAAGVEDGTPVVWNVANSWLVPVDKFTPDMMPFILGDDEFEVVDVELVKEETDDRSEV